MRYVEPISMSRISGDRAVGTRCRITAGAGPEGTAPGSHPQLRSSSESGLPGITESFHYKINEQAYLLRLFLVVGINGIEGVGIRHPVRHNLDQLTRPELRTDKVFRDQNYTKPGDGGLLQGNAIVDRVTGGY